MRLRPPVVMAARGKLVDIKSFFIVEIAIPVSNHMVLNPVAIIEGKSKGTAIAATACVIIPGMTFLAARQDHEGKDRKNEGNAPHQR